MPSLSGRLGAIAQGHGELGALALEASDKRPVLCEGEMVRLSFDPIDAHLFDGETRLRL